MIILSVISNYDFSLLQAPIPLSLPAQRARCHTLPKGRAWRPIFPPLAGLGEREGVKKNPLPFPNPLAPVAPVAPVAPLAHLALWPFGLLALLALWPFGPFPFPTSPSLLGRGVEGREGRLSPPPPLSLPKGSGESCPFWRERQSPKGGGIIQLNLLDIYIIIYYLLFIIYYLSYSILI